MKRNLFCVLCISLMLILSGCTNYSNIDSALEQVVLENTLPEVEDGKYKSLAEADDAIYKQQIAACELYNESYTKTYYKQFLEGKYKTNKVANICTSYRIKLNDDIKTEFYKNIYKIVRNCEDCTNKNSFLEKANNDVLLFYDAYMKYQEAENPEEALCDILVNYSERKNTLALSFLDRNRNKVYDAAVNLIEENAATDENFRFYLNKNNNIITALNEIYDGVPEKYAPRISEATAKLSKNLLDSLESLTERERLSLIDQLNLATPSPSPSPTLLPTAIPEVPVTEAPKRTVVPATQVPTRTAVPATQAPVRTSAPISEQEHSPIIEPDIAEETEETKRPSYSFSVDD